MRGKVEALVLSLLLAMVGCGFARIEQRGAPAAAFDVVVVPGCPTEDDGRPSRCQLARAAWAAVLWERGWADKFITSGSDVHSRYVEAEALAQIMTALGVPADRIYLERDALHTDENMFFSLRIARRLGARTIAVASSRGHALWGCKMMLDWGQDCRVLSLDRAAVEARLKLAAPGVVDGLRASAIPLERWVPLATRERDRTAATGRRRPASWLLYPTIAFLRLAGERWVPIPPGESTVRTWAQHLLANAEMALDPGGGATP